MTSDSTTAVALRQEERGAEDIGSHSPCIGVCALDPVTGWCSGCARTGDEIAAWGTADAADKQRIWGQLPPRLNRIGLRRRIMPWSPAGILDAVVQMLQKARGEWIIEVPDGTTARFMTGELAAPVKQEEHAVVATNHEAQFTLRTHDKLRAFGFGPPAAPTAIVLTLPQGRIEFQPRERQVADPRSGALTSMTETCLARISRPASAAALPVARQTSIHRFELPGWAGVIATFISHEHR